MPLEFIKTGGLTSAEYKDSLEVVVSDPVLAALPNGDPLKRSKKIALGALPTKFVDWDVTPTVTTDATVLEFTDTESLTVSNAGSLTIDYTGAPVFSGPQPVFWGGAVKTNLDLSKLTVGSAFHIGYEFTSVAPTYAPFLLGFVLDDPAKSAADVLAGVLSELGQGSSGPATHASILSMVLMYGTQKQTGVSWIIPNDVDPLFADANGGLYVKNQPLLAPLDFGSKVIMALGREAGSISVANINVAPNGTTYDITDATQITDNPVLPANTTLFYFIIGLDFGQGYPVISIKPTLASGSPSYDVTGTTYGTAHGGTNGTWATLFPNPITEPISTVVTHAVFPDTATEGRGLRAIVDPGYTDPYPPMPYGIKVGHNTKCIVDNITLTNESFTPLASSQEIAVLTDQATQTQEQLTALSLAVASAGRTETMGEVVIFVRPPLGVVNEPVIPAGPTVFDTFDLAYTYALTLPLYLKKRLVLDDRSTANYTGVIRAAVDENSPTTFKLYELLANNITISGYSTFSSTTHALPYNPQVSLQIQCDGLRIEDLSLSVTQCVDSLGGTFPMFDLSTSVTAPNGVVTPDNLIIGKNSVLVSDGYAIGMEDGGTVYIDDGGHWILFVFHITKPQYTAAIDIFKAPHGKVTISGNIETTALTGSYSINIFMEHDGNQPVLSGGVENAVYIGYLDSAPPPRLVYGDYKVIQSRADFLQILSLDSPTLIYVSSYYTYFIVGAVDLTDMSLSIRDDNAPIRFMGLPGSQLIANGTVFTGVYPPQSNPNLIIEGVDIVCRNDSVRGLSLWGSVTLKNLTVYAASSILVADHPGYQGKQSFDANNVRFLHPNGTPVTVMPSIDVTGRVIMDGIYIVKTGGTPAINVAIKPANVRDTPVVLNNINVTFHDDASLTTPSVVFDLGDYKTSGAVYRNDSVKVTGVRVNFGDAINNARYELFSVGGVVHPHQTDPVINVGTELAFADMFANGMGATLVSYQEVTYNGYSPANMFHFIQAGNGLQYTGHSSCWFELAIDYSLYPLNVPDVQVVWGVRVNGNSMGQINVNTLLGALNVRQGDALRGMLRLSPGDIVTITLLCASSCIVGWGQWRYTLRQL